MSRTPLDVVDETIEPAASIQYRSLADRLSKLGKQGTRLPTGFKTLDAATRGGPRSGRIIVPGGAPGAGKTTWVVQIGVRYAQHGTFVAVLAADEEADGLAIRVAQQFGFDRDAIEEGQFSGPFTSGVREKLEALPLLLVDAVETGATVEDVFAEGARRAEGKPWVFIVDSVQTAQCAGSAEAESPRARVDLVMAALKRGAKETDCLVIATCELARGSYRNKNSAEQIDDLAAFKESGGIEYSAALALVLRSDKGGVVNVTMPKNRMGQKLPFRLKQDYATATLKEVDMPSESELEAQREAAVAIQQSTTRTKDEGAIYEALVKGGELSAKELRGLCSLKHDRVDGALVRLREAGRVSQDGANSPHTKIPKWRVKPTGLAPQHVVE